MGLDMFLYATTMRLTRPVDFPEPVAFEQLHFWRKHPNLHGWMECLYYRKGGRDPDFNMSPVVLDAADLNALEATVRARRLPVTVGFFFGVSDGSEIDDDLTVIARARAAIAAGKSVYYVASW